MARSYINYPQDIDIATPVGPVSLAVTERDHIHVCSRTKSGNEYLTANRVEYYVSMHLYRQADGSYNFSKTDEAYIRRAGTFDNRSATTSAFEKIKKAIIPAVNGWVKSNPGIIEQAEHAHINNQLRSLEEKVEKATKELQAKQDELQQLLDKHQDMQLSPCALPFANIKLPEHSFPEGSDIDLLHKIVKASIPQIFIESHLQTADPEELKLEALGILVAKFCEWSGTDILEVCAYALEDANFHAEAKQIRQMMNKLNA